VNARETQICPGARATKRAARRYLLCSLFNVEYSSERFGILVERREVIYLFTWGRCHDMDWLAFENTTGNGSSGMHDGSLAMRGAASNETKLLLSICLMLCWLVIIPVWSENLKLHYSRYVK
jgi:hypothetical protein